MVLSCGGRQQSSATQNSSADFDFAQPLGLRRLPFTLHCRSLPGARAVGGPSRTLRQNHRCDLTWGCTHASKIIGPATNAGDRALVVTQQPGSLEELARLFADGKIDRATFLANATVFHAELSGSGALAQGPGAMATGSGGVGIGGDNNAPININNINNINNIIQQAARPGASPADLRRAYVARILIQAN